ncbi:MAG: hypothetical protein ACM3VW_03880 [Bacteroidota bacterium]
MKSTAADWPMIRLMIVLAAGAAAMMLLVAWQEGKLPLATSLATPAVSAPSHGGQDSNRNDAEGGYRIINGAADRSEPFDGVQVALRFKQTETKQGLGSTDDQRPRPGLSGSNRGKSLKQS